MGKPRTSWTLAELKAEWRESTQCPRWGSRYQTGLSFLCPLHQNHRLKVRLVNPGDGDPEEYWRGSVRAWRWSEMENGGHTISELTLTRPDGDSPLDFGTCGQLRIIDGVVSQVR